MMIKKLVIILFMILTLGLCGCGNLNFASDNKNNKSDKNTTGQINQGDVKDTTGIKEDNSIVHLDIVNESNIFFAKYDINILIDDTKVGSVKNGGRFTGDEMINCGKHTIKFTDSTHESTSIEQNFDVTSECTVKYKLKAHELSIEILSSSILEGAENNEISVPDLCGYMLPEAKNILKSLGVENIKTSVNSNEFIIDENNWIVFNQSISAGSKVDKYEKIELVCGRIKDFVNQYLNLKSVVEIMELSEKYGFEINYVDYSTGNDVYPDKKDENINEWTVVGYETPSASIKKVTFKIRRGGEDTITSAPISGNETTLEQKFPKELAYRAVITAITNYYALDVFSGNEIDSSKFHSYSDSSGNKDDYYLIVNNEGIWTANDDETWHVRGMQLYKSGGGSTFGVTADVKKSKDGYEIYNVVDANGTSDSDTHLYPDENLAYIVTEKMVEQGRNIDKSDVEDSGLTSIFDDYNIKTVVLHDLALFIPENWTFKKDGDMATFFGDMVYARMAYYKGNGKKDRSVKDVEKIIKSMESGGDKYGSMSTKIKKIGNGSIEAYVTDFDSKSGNTNYKNRTVYFQKNGDAYIIFYVCLDSDKYDSFIDTVSIINDGLYVLG